MNLNKNPRFEYFHVTWDPGVVGLLSGLASEIWESPALAEAVKMRPQQHKNIFGEMGVESSPEPATRVGGAEIDVCLYPNNGRGRGRSRESVVDPKEKSAVSEEAEHWPLNAAGKTGQDRCQGGQPWPVRRVPIGRGGGAEGTVPQNPEPDRGKVTLMQIAPQGALASVGAP